MYQGVKCPWVGALARRAQEECPCVRQAWGHRPVVPSCPSLQSRLRAASTATAQRTGRQWSEATSVSICVCMLQQLRAPSTIGRMDDRAASLLYFDGRPQAHGLFEYLLHESMSPSETSDVPMLLAPEPFIGACLYQHIPHVSVTSLHNLIEAAHLLPPTSARRPSLQVPSASVTVSSMIRKEAHSPAVSTLLMSLPACGERPHG